MAGNQRIHPSTRNPFYWEYGGRMQLLVGGSNDDNLFQWTGSDLTDHLDLLVDCGGNYVRNTMSDRDPGNVYAFDRGADGRFDLSRKNREYWERLETFLTETSNRGVVVELTLWDQHDLWPEAWKGHPWNPECNANYSVETLISAGAFFRTVEEKNEAVLEHQRRFVEWILELSLPFGNVLYNINNESWTGLDWERYWARMVREKAADRKQIVSVTTMHLSPSTSVRAFMNDRELYDFAEISQNNQVAMGNEGQAHMDELLRWRGLISGQAAAPMNNEKIYGGGEVGHANFGSAAEAQRRFWRNIYGGCASVRFHRPADRELGLGLTETAQRMIRSADMFLEAFDLFGAVPANDLFVECGDDRAYCLASIGKEYAFYFTDGGTIAFDPWVYVESLEVRWLNIDESKWAGESERVDVEWEFYTVFTGDRSQAANRGVCRLACPAGGQWLAVATAN